MRILSVSTSLSEDSTTLKLATKILAATASAGEQAGIAVDTDHINIRTLTTSLTDMALTGLRSVELEAAFAKVARADAVVTVTPVYKTAPVGLHTLFWQLIDDRALTGKSVLIASTGGTPRHSQAAETMLRPVLAYLKGVLVPTAVFAATDDWGSVEGGRGLTSRIDSAAAELVDLTAQLGGISLTEAAAHERGLGSAAAVGPAATGPNRHRPPRDGARHLVDEFDPATITPFAQLLQG